MVKKGFQGHIEGVQLEDLLQMLCQSYSSAELKISNSLKDSVVQLIDGEVSYASCGEKSGEGALLDVLTWENGEVDITSSFVSRDRNVHSGWMELLLQSAHAIDKRRVEKKIERKKEVISREQVGGAKESNKEMFYEHLDKGWKFFRESDYERALQEWEVAYELDPNDKTIHFNLKKIKELIGKK
jgi:tetratricopeptide (TPR) repeat protein